nr:stealth family protein [uncultured Celeribacter sp.]
MSEVETKPDKKVEELDAVILWVDGNDPAHRAKREATLAQMGVTQAGLRNAASETRFADNDEIYFCVASLLKYAPFIRRIHIVTDTQRPRWIDAFAREGLCAPDKIRIVDHREIFRGYEAALPTFNCRSIEALLWKIPDLAEHFIYLNDDFFLNAPAKPTDFVSSDGKLWLEGTVKSVRTIVWQDRLKNLKSRLAGQAFRRTSFQSAQALAASLVLARRFLALEHTPRPMRRSTLQTYFSRQPEQLRKQISYPFRSNEQFSPYALANALEIAAGTAVAVSPRPSIFIKSGGPRLDAQIEQVMREDMPSGCVQSLDRFDRADQDRLTAALVQKFADFLPKTLVEKQSDVRVA